MKAVIPMIIPKSVRNERSLWPKIAAIASLKVSARFIYYNVNTEKFAVDSLSEVWHYSEVSVTRTFQSTTK